MDRGTVDVIDAVLAQLSCNTGRITVLFLALSAALFWLDRALISDVVRFGIVSFEFAATGVRSAEILDAWGDVGIKRALTIQAIDFLYLLVYPVWFALVLRKLTRNRGGAIGRGCAWVSVAVIVAAPLDAMENVALVYQLIASAAHPAALIAAGCASVKFALVAAAVIAIVAALIKLGVEWVKARRADHG
ncbi:MAG: hypothetical protein AAF493_01140 [Pseudomonadota bacterium]